ncbi:hypothetical protein [uncultured Tenacibaculum sp.]|uniref:hypothetical protein n=1 Tax=uncultured Tenacibaculum sp. TaxID=174713 RepID=UPI00262D326B|nr:hypothetical protein [uncultured Tenacibaculum sp.]
MINNISNLGATLNKEELQSIKGGGYGSVTCGDGTVFEATAESMNSVVQGGTFWCLHHGHGNPTNFSFNPR